jgi:hypothetical protein
MIAITQEMIEQVDRTPAAFQPNLLRQWQARGYDIEGSPFGVILFAKGPRKKKAKKGGCTKRCRLPAVSRIGDRVREKTAWTGIPSCQRCRELAARMNQMTAAEVRENIEPLSAQMLSNIVHLSKGNASDLGWWDRLDARAKTWAALKTLGEDGVQVRCKAVILEACNDEDTESSSDSVCNVDATGSGNALLVESVKELHQPPLVEDSSLAPAVHVLNGTVDESVEGNGTRVNRQSEREDDGKFANGKSLPHLENNVGHPIDLPQKPPHDPTPAP